MQDVRLSINYSLLIGEEKIPYVIRFSRKAKHLQLRISQSKGLELIIPKQYSLKDGERFIAGRKDWIMKHYSAPPRENAYYLYGKEIKVVQTFNLFIKRHRIKLKEGELIIESPAGDITPTNELFDVYLKHSARRYITARVEELAMHYGFTPRNINLRKQKTRWGSCSSKGHLSFNYKLMMYRKEVIDYVIIHELCHLREMNHSIRFWNLVQRFNPNYKLLKNELKRGPQGI